MGEQSSVTFNAPTDLIVAKNRTLTIHGYNYFSPSGGNCSAITGVDNSQLTSVTNSGDDGCTIVIDPVDTYEGNASFSFTFTTFGGDSATGRIDLRVGPASTITFTAPSPNPSVVVNQRITIDASEYAKEASASYSIDCSAQKSVTGGIRITRDKCVYTVTAGPAAGSASFVVPYRSTGGHTLEETINITINNAADSSITFNAPSSLVFHSGSRNAIDLSYYASDGSYAISCTSVTASAGTIRNRDTNANSCSFDLQTSAAGSFTVAYRSFGGDTHTGTVAFTTSLTSSRIGYTAPASTPTVAPGESITLDAAALVSDGSYSIFCTAPQNVTARISVTKNRCVYTITGRSVGSATFRIQWRSSGGDSHQEDISVTVEIPSDIVYTAPASNLQIGARNSKTFDLSTYAVDGSHTITCSFDQSSRHSLLTSVVATGCSFAVTAGRTQGAATIAVTYTSSGGDTHSASIPITVGPRSYISFFGPSGGLNIGAGNTRTFDLSSYATDGSYDITCSFDQSSRHSLLTSVTPTGCSFAVTAGSTQGAATIALTYTSAGGHTRNATIALNIGAASSITYTAPTGLRVRTSASIAIDASGYASDSDYTITCADATSVSTTLASVTRTTGTCIFSITAGATAGTGTFTIPYTSDGGDTHNGQVSITIAASEIEFNAPAALSVTTGGTLTINAASYASDGSNTITCADATSISASLASVVRTANTCSYTITGGSSQGMGSFSIRYTSSGGDTHDAVISVRIGPAASTAFTALTASGCTDGTFVDTTANPRLVGANNDLVDDCQALVAIQTHLSANSANSSLLSTHGLRQWGTGATATAKRIATTGTGFRATNTWKGVTVSGGRVTSLDLSGFTQGAKAAGTIPAAIGNLTALTALYLNANDFTGSIPTALGSLTSLTYLDLSNNKFSGSIPTQLGSLTSLADLNLSNNQLSGSIPTQLGSLTALAGQFSFSPGLDLSNNQLTGPIPTQLSALTSLKKLKLQGNYLTGSIPSALSSLTALTELRINNNWLEGSFPTQLTALTSVISIYLCNNYLTGTIPSSLRSRVRDTTQHTPRIGCQRTSDISFTAPTGLTVNTGASLEIDASSYATDGRYAITCADATGRSATLASVTRTANTCTYNITAGAAAGTGSFNIAFTSSGGDTHTGAISLTITAATGASSITFTAPTVNPAAAAGGSVKINAASYASDGDYTISCGTATSVSALISSIARVGCTYTVTAGNTAGRRILHRALHLSRRRHRIRHDHRHHRRSLQHHLHGPHEPERAAGRLSHHRRHQPCLQTAATPSPAATPQCEPPRTAAPSPSVSRSGCNYRITPSGTVGSFSFSMTYTSSGGDTETGIFSVRVTASTSLVFNFTDPNLTLASGASRIINAADYASHGSHAISCGQASSISSTLTVTKRRIAGDTSGCSFSVVAGSPVRNFFGDIIRTTPSAPGTATFTIAYTSAGGGSRSGTITVTIGAASNIVFTAPAGANALSVEVNRRLVVDADSYAADGSYDITCADATSVSSLISVARSGCDFTVTAGSTTGTASFTVLYTSAGGDTHSGTDLRGRGSSHPRIRHSLHRPCDLAGAAQPRLEHQRRQLRHRRQLHDHLHRHHHIVHHHLAQQHQRLQLPRQRHQHHRRGHCCGRLFLQRRRHPHRQYTRSEQPRIQHRLQRADRSQSRHQPDADRQCPRPRLRRRLHHHLRRSHRDRHHRAIHRRPRHLRRRLHLHHHAQGRPRHGQLHRAPHLLGHREPGHHQCRLLHRSRPGFRHRLHQPQPRPCCR